MNEKLIDIILRWRCRQYSIISIYSRTMLRQYHSLGHKSEDYTAGADQGNSVRVEGRHKQIGDKSTIINQRVQKIKNKYAIPMNLKHNFIASQSISMLAYTANENKQNDSHFLNASSIEYQEETMKNPPKELKHKKHKKSTRQSDRIQELEEINLKISKLIQTLRLEESNQSKQDNNCQSVQVPTTYNLIGQRNKYLLSSTKISLNESKRSRVKTQSLECSNRSNRSSSVRENGKLTKPKALTKSVKEMNYQNEGTHSEISQEKMVKELCRQVEYDQKYTREKTKLMKSSKRCKQLLEFAVKNTQLSAEEKELILDWNFQDIDPLYTERKSSRSSRSFNQNQLVYSTIDSFLQCQDHWRRKVYQKFNIREVSFKDLDSLEKGYFLKEDFTQFLSLKSKQMYCNRDISLILRRINRKKNKIVPMEDIIRVLCQ